MPGPTNVSELVSQIRKMNVEMTSPYNDGYTAWGIKQDLFMVKFFLDKVITDAPTFGEQEKNWL